MNKRDFRIFNYYFLYSFLLLNPIWVLYLLKHNFSLYEITLLDVIYYLTMTALSFPSGKIVDEIGRVYSLSISSLITGIAILIFGISPSFLGISISYVFWGFGNALNSTAIETISYEHSIMRGLRYLRFFGIVNFMGSLSVALASLVGGFLSYNFGFKQDIILTAVFVILSAYLALSIREPFVRQQEGKAKGVFHYVKDRDIISALIIRVALILDFNILILFKQPYYVSLGIDTVLIGTIFFVDVMIRGLSFLFSQDIKIFRKNSFGTMLILGSAMFFTIYIPGIFPNLISIALLITNSGLFGLYTNLLSKEMNDALPSNVRGQVLSMIYLITSLLTAIAEPALGYIATEKGVVFTLFIFSAIFFILLVGGISVKITHKTSYKFRRKWI